MPARLELERGTDILLLETGFALLLEMPVPMNVQVGGVSQSILDGTIEVETRIEERSTAFFVVEDIDESLAFSKGQPVLIYDTGANLIFGGYVNGPGQQRVSPDGGIFHDITCMDYHYTADKRRVAESYIATSAGDIVTDLRTKYLLDEGVTVGNIEAGPTVLEVVFNYVKLSDALDKLAEAAGFVWFIDENKALYFQARSTTAAPWALVDGGRDILTGSSRFSGANSKYRNRQYIRGGRDVTGAQTETFTADGDMVSFTVGYGINAEPTVKEDGGAAKSMGIKGIDTAKDYYWAKGDPVVLADAAPAGGVVVTIEYIGEYDVLVLATDETAIATLAATEGSGTGWVDAIDDEPKLDDKDAAFDVAQSKLARFAVTGAKLEYDTLRRDLRPGQLQTVTLAKYGLSAAEMLIESVTFRSGLKGETTHSVQAIQGPEEGSWAKFFLTMASAKDEIMDRLNVGADQILIILVQREETWEWGETIVTSPFACFPCAPTTICGPTLIVC